MVHQEVLTLRTQRPGLLECTELVEKVVVRSGIKTGLAHVFCRHTSASLVIMENADPSARCDLEAWMDRLVPAKDILFTHTSEGPDDMPSHIKMALTRTSETIPVGEGGRLLLGTWQGIFLWEHRFTPHTRCLVVTVTGE
ncbi:hypothetical protein IMCC26134_01000 [Verrucomicrobia bacterium IMCC26134]|jgi:secondary thiamine-phosphate synthase enzyme|nr:hypothetical protein IMCC26134_01000 [Verrucomicrobia bacterium IMCC26134]